MLYEANSKEINKLIIDILPYLWRYEGEKEYGFPKNVFFFGMPKSANILYAV